MRADSHGERVIHVCVPVLKRYDLLRGLLQSLERGTIKPNAVYVIDNGMNYAKLESAIIGVIDCTVATLTPKQPMGIAESWNWFIDHVAEERVIVNDDVVFASDSLEKLVASDADLVWAEGCGFSCFVLRDACVKKLGLFDETISPGYGYYEDEDYLQRLDGRGTRAPSAVATNVECGVVHLKSSTLKVASYEEMKEHHRLFKIAQGNYKAKWPECGL